MKRKSPRYERGLILYTTGEDEVFQTCPGSILYFLILSNRVV
jgi:hypothetical protein